MTSNSRRLAIVLVLLFAGCAKARPVPITGPAVPAAPPLAPVEQLQADISSSLDQPGHRRATWGIAIQSLTRNERLYAHNPGLLLVPGSTLKIVTAALAAAAVGWDYTFETTAEASGDFHDESLEGDLVLTGTGDPTLLGRAGEDFAEAVTTMMAQRGIAHISGRIVGNDNLVEEPRPAIAWSWEDLSYPFGALSGGLNIAENAMRVVVTPGASDGAPTGIELPPEAGDFPILNQTVTGRPGSGQTLWAEQRPLDARLIVAGSLAAGSKPATLRVAVGNPTLWFARVVRARILRDGFIVSGGAVDVDDLPAPPKLGEVLLSHRSPPLSAIVRPMLKDSINLYADAVLRLVTGPAGERQSDAAIAAARPYLAAWGIPEDAIQMLDGSGLSRRDAAAPEALLAVLQRHYDSTGASPFMQGLPIAGVDGSLASRMKDTPAAGNARAKTGTMSNIRTLAGYVTTKDGEPLAFVIMANNFEGEPAATLATIDRIVVRLASFSRN